MSNSEVKYKVLGPKVQYLEQALVKNRRRMLGHVYRIFIERPPHYALFFKTVTVGERLEKASREESMKTLRRGQTGAVAVRLTGCGPRDFSQK